MAPVASPLNVEEGGRADVRLPQHGSQRPFGDVARMTRDGGLATVAGVAPELVASLRLTVELEAQATQSARHFEVAEARQPTHASAVRGVRRAPSATVRAFVAF